MKLLGFKVRLSVNVLNLRRLPSIILRSTSLFGVGGRGKAGFWMRAMSVAAIAWLFPIQSSVRSGVVAQLLGKLKPSFSAKPLFMERVVIASCS